MKRREIIFRGPAIVAASQLAWLPNKAEAIDPITLTILVALIPAGASIYQARVQANAQIEAQKENASMYVRLQEMQQEFQRSMFKMSEEFEIRKTRMQLGLASVVQEYAYTQDGQPARMVITRSVDGSGTMVGINGAFGTRRNNYEGTFSNAEAEILSQAFAEKGRMPVAVEEGYNNSTREQMGVLSEKFSRNERIIATRRFSSAKYPTKDGADILTAHYVKPDNTVDAKFFNLRHSG
jgi:hypothetical protein